MSPLRLFALVGIVCWIGSVEAQIIDRFGVRVGGGMTKLAFEADAGYEGLGLTERESLHLAGSAQTKPLRPGWRVVFELEYALVRYQWPNGYGIGLDLSDRDDPGVLYAAYQLPASTLHYLSAPVLLRAGPAKAGPLYVTGGLQLDVLLATQSGVLSGGLEGARWEEPDVLPDMLESSGLSGVAGIGGALFSVASMDVLFEVRYRQSLSNLIDSEQVDLVRRGFDLSLGLAF